MAKINWDSTGNRIYEAGLDRVVLYVGSNPGIHWSGLYSVEESITGGEAQPLYIDGFKYLNLSTREEFGATINALNIPEEFRVCEGSRTMANGLEATQQLRMPFSLSYRTLIGSDTQRLKVGYKIHLIYRAMAAPSNRTHTTLHNEASMETYSWACSTRPYSFSGFKPIAHLIIDSRKTNPEYLIELEDLLYGSINNDPMLLNPGEVASVLSGNGYTITDD